MYYLGLDIGSSSVKAGLVDASNGKSIHSVHEPNNEMGIISKRDEWAEQDPNDWWLHTCNEAKLFGFISSMQIQQYGLSDLSFTTVFFGFFG